LSLGSSCVLLLNVSVFPKRRIPSSRRKLFGYRLNPAHTKPKLPFKTIAPPMFKCHKYPHPFKNPQITKTATENTIKAAFFMTTTMPPAKFQIQSQSLKPPKSLRQLQPFGLVCPSIAPLKLLL